jgi:hypothetical protein
MTLKGSEMLELFEASSYCTPAPWALHQVRDRNDHDTTVPYVNATQYPDPRYAPPTPAPA